jgi:hypothetical protein
MRAFYALSFIVLLAWNEITSIVAFDEEGRIHHKSKRKSQSHAGDFSESSNLWGLSKKEAHLLAVSDLCSLIVDD